MERVLIVLLGVGTAGTTRGPAAETPRLLLSSVAESGDVRMAQKIQTLLIDDLDGGEAADTVRLGLDGTDYEIDLSADHAADLHGALALYVKHARRVGSAPKEAPRQRRRGPRPDGLDTVAMRAWAKDQGLKVNNRGRMPADIVAKYRAATRV